MQRSCARWMPEEELARRFPLLRMKRLARSLLRALDMLAAGFSKAHQS
jgi:hypothetical protein